MTRHGPLVKALALVAAVGVHIGLASVLVDVVSVKTEGVSGGPDVKLGSRFQDLVQGGLASAQVPETPVAAVVPTLNAAQPVRPITAAPSAKTADLVSQPVVPQAFGEVQTNRNLELPVAAPSTVRPFSPETRSIVSPQTRDEEKRDAPAREMEQDANPTLSNTPRPTARPIRETRRDTATSARPTVAGNAAQNADAGASGGTQDGTSVTRGQNGRQSNAGTAAADNYPGEVMRCISRAGRPRVTAHGAAVVAFQLSDSGRIVNPRIAATSGNTRLDRAALAIVRNAGPCPKPPTHAQTRFRVRVEGR